MSSPQLILASSSPRRRELMALLDTPLHVESADIDESQHAGEPPAEYAQRLSREKALAVAERHADAVVIAADTIVVHQGVVLGKPRDEAEAKTMLRALAGQRHLVLTAVTVHNGSTGKTLTDLCESRVTMRDYSDEEIGAYIASGTPMDKAGAYAIQDAEFAPAVQVVGCPANVMGLPMCHVLRSLHRVGVELPPSRPSACRVQFGGYYCALTDIAMPGVTEQGIIP